jgi:hypothetical protein
MARVYNLQNFIMRKFSMKIPMQVIFCRKNGTKIVYYCQLKMILMRWRRMYVLCMCVRLRRRTLLKRLSCSRHRLLKRAKGLTCVCQ